MLVHIKRIAIVLLEHSMEMKMFLFMQSLMDMVVPSVRSTPTMVTLSTDSVPTICIPPLKTPSTHLLTKRTLPNALVLVVSEKVISDLLQVFYVRWILSMAFSYVMLAIGMP